MGTGKGYGKTILFGEHFVVFGFPAIASALGSSTIANVKVVEGKGWTVDDQRPATPGYGVGASAAQCTSLARALNDTFNLVLDDEKINEAAYEGEKAYHGTPSGIDNTASTYGGLIWFVKNLSGGKNTMDLWWINMVR